MATSAQTIGIAAAFVATFAGVYFIAPAGNEETSGIAAEAAKAGNADGDGKVANPLEPAERGLIECHAPNEQRKTCRGMSRYKRLGEGKYRDTTVMLIANDGPVLLEISLPATVKAGSVCTVMSPDDYRRGKLAVEGRLLSSGQAAPILAMMSGFARRYNKKYMNKELCSSYTSKFGELTIRPAFEGVPQPEFNGRVKWIGPNDGYTVGP